MTRRPGAVLPRRVTLKYDEKGRRVGAKLCIVQWQNGQAGGGVSRDSIAASRCTVAEGLVMTEPAPYEVYAVHYAHNPNARRANNFIGGDPHDGPMPLDYFVWAIKGPERTFVFDTGFDAPMGEKRQPAVRALARRSG